MLINRHDVVKMLRAKAVQSLQDTDDEALYQHDTYMRAADLVETFNDTEQPERVAAEVMHVEVNQGWFDSGQNRWIPNTTATVKVSGRKFAELLANRVGCYLDLVFGEK